MEYRAIYKETSDDIQHWKYIKKVKKNGKWRYYYDKESLMKDAKDKFNSIYNDPDNIYDVDASNYNQRIEQIKNSKEWQDIVKRNDPEYVRTDKDGNKQYLIDDYLVKKKHPELDVISDLGAGRKVSLNKVTAKSLIAGGKDYIRTAQNMIGILAVALTEKFKYSQGSYSNDINTAKKSAMDTYKEVSKTTKSVTKSATATYNNLDSAAKNVAKTAYKVNTLSNSDINYTVQVGAAFVATVLKNYN